MRVPVIHRVGLRPARSRPPIGRLSSAGNRRCRSVRLCSLRAHPTSEKFYILNMVGDLPSGGATPEGFETLKQVTKLEHKGDEILLSRVATAPKIIFRSQEPYFTFSRDLALRSEDKQATFVTKLGPIDVKCKFTLKDMIYHGEAGIIVRYSPGGIDPPHANHLFIDRWIYEKMRDWIRPGGFLNGWCKRRSFW